MLASVEKRVLDAVKKLKSEYPIDTTYLMGFSQGAMTTLRTGLNHPGHFAGLIAFGGWIDTKQPINLNRAGKSAPSICIVHGKKDNSIKYEEALNAEKILNANQYRLKLLTFDGGHEVPAEMLKQAMEWIAGKK